ncbi:MAG: peptidoglycan-binding protein [Clostridium sp.]|nr:peptidoglycan-binding protein [Clostridium sp.]
MPLPGDNALATEPIDAPHAGALKVSLTSSTGIIPIANATVTIYTAEEPDVPFETLTTDSSGQTEIVELPAPPLEWSLEPSAQQPYSLYNLHAAAEGYEPVLITGIEILADQLSLQPILMNPLSTTNEAEKIVVIAPHVLFYDYPPKIPEEEIKPLAETGEIVLSQVVIPEFIIVHDGLPTDSTAANYWVRYKDYIKNVASCEIYSTWPEASIYANILAIMSFTLNRVYTEWYRNQGYDFTITSSTAYDQKWIYGRNIYENIDFLVDTVFANYLSRPGVRQPIFTAYCDGNRVSCNGLSQWGSKYLGDEGYSAIDIIRHYYGNDMYINTAESISGVPSSWPGYDLSIGSAGEKVRQLQTQLNRIANNYPAIPVLVADGIYGPQTAESVSIFQGIFNLPQTGVTDYATWYEVSEIYVGVSRIAEPGS